MPHIGVYHPKKPEQIRVVFDCSAQWNGVSLNDYLLQGPDFMNDLLGILFCFRQESVAFMTDTKSMFHQSVVAEEHQEPVAPCDMSRGQNISQIGVVKYKKNISSPEETCLCNISLRHVILIVILSLPHVPATRP